MKHRTSDLLSFCCAALLALCPLFSGAAHAEGETKPLTIPQTGYTTPVPAVYSTPAERQGTVEWITYNSEDYLNGNAPVQKTAAVYLPYGYDPNDAETRYDILYLMHGWGGSAGEYFQRGSSVTSVKNMLDHMIESGEIKPIIAVSATFYNEHSDRDFGASEDALREFHREFETYLMPAVEGRYHTFAEDTTPEALAASRDHRAFGGFSLGSVTTWMQFCYDPNMVEWFAKMVEERKHQHDSSKEKKNW